jgi:hypothetical protein
MAAGHVFVAVSGFWGTPPDSNNAVIKDKLRSELPSVGTDNGRVVWFVGELPREGVLGRADL